MIGKIIGAIAGSQAARYSHKLGGPAGAALGFVAVPLIRRIRIPALLAFAAGGYAVKKLNDKAAEAAATPNAGTKAGKN